MHLFLHLRIGTSMLCHFVQTLELAVGGGLAHAFD